MWWDSRRTTKGRVAERVSAFWLLECLCVLSEHQHALNQQLAQHDQLLSGQQLVTVRAFEFEGQVGGHGVERGKGFAGLDQQGFGGDVWGDCARVSRPGIKEPGASESAPRTAAIIRTSGC